jgi:hypothetical protein
VTTSESISLRALPTGQSSPLSADLLWGVDAIADEIGLTRRQTYYQLESGRLPAMKQAGKWTASRSGLRTHFGKILGGKVA